MNPSSSLTSDPPFLSIIVPVFNEAENLPQLVEQLRAHLGQIGKSYEILIIDDGSTDATAEVLAGLAGRGLRAIRLRRNSGQTAAMMAGIGNANGEILIPMDGDLQNDPADIPRLIEKLDEGFDVVSGWRKDRQDAALRRNFPSRVANALISAVSGVRLHDYGCSLKAYRREALQGVRLYGEMHRFIPIYAHWNGARVTELPVRHHPRTRGVSKYGLQRIPKVLLDLLVVVFLHRFGQKPMYVFGGFGLACLAVSFLAGAGAVYYKFFGGKSFIETPLPILVAMAFITGIMCLLLGLLAELMVRTYYESQNKDTYSITPGRPDGPTRP